MASFDFLGSESVGDDDDDEDDDDGMANGDGYNGSDTRMTTEQLLANRFQVLYRIPYNGDFVCVDKYLYQFLLVNTLASSHRNEPSSISVSVMLHQNALPCELF